MIKPVHMGHGLKRSYFSEKWHSGYVLLSSGSKPVFRKVHQSGPVWLWIQKVMPSGLEEVTLSYKILLSNHWLAWFLLPGIYLYVRELDVFWVGQLEDPTPSLFSRGVRLQSVLSPISPALSCQCLASIRDPSSTFVGKIAKKCETKCYFLDRQVDSRMMPVSTCDCVAATSLLVQEVSECMASDDGSSGKVPWHLKD